MTEEFTDIMVDIETTDTQPDRGAILQIAAVKFNLTERTVSSDYFDRCLTIPPHRRWSESTQDWWYSKRRPLLESLLLRAEPYGEVIKDFAQWCYPPGKYRFWSKPSHFDYMFLSSYFSDAGLINPFAYWEAQDLRSFIRGQFFPKDMPKLDIPFTGEAHNALWDTFHQVKMLFAYADEAEDQRSAVEIFPPSKDIAYGTVKLGGSVMSMSPDAKLVGEQGPEAVVIDIHTRTGDI